APPPQALVVARRAPLPRDAPRLRHQGDLFLVGPPGGLAGRKALELRGEVLAPPSFDDPVVETGHARLSAERLEHPGEQPPGRRMRLLPVREQGELSARGFPVVDEAALAQDSPAAALRQRRDPLLELREGLVLIPSRGPFRQSPPLPD